MEKEVLSKHRKALMLFGTAHLYHGGSAPGFATAVQLYEQRYPGITMVIESGNDSVLEGYNQQFEKRTTSWPIPSLVSDLTGTWLADWLDKARNSEGVVVVFKSGPGGETIISPQTQRDSPRTFSKRVDAYLYLGPQELLLSEPRPAEIFLNNDFMAEARRRADIMGPGPITDQAKPEKISDRDYSPFLLDEIKRDIKAAQGQTIQPRTPSKHTEIAVDPKLFDGYVGRYDLGSGMVLNITRDGNSLFGKLGNQPRFEMFPESTRDYFLKAVDAQVTFVTDAQGRANELILHQAGDHLAKRIE